MESRITCRAVPETVKFPLLMMLKHQAEDAVVSGRCLTIPIRFGFRAVTEDEKTEVMVITCRLAVAYELTEGYEPTPEQIEAFRQGNAIFNCWSYFREYVQNSVARMNFPPVTIPFLRMVPRAISETSAAVPKVIDSAAQIEEPAEKRIKGRRKRNTKDEI
jgi:hypothetical protein